VDLLEVDDLEAEVLRRPPTKLVAITDADDVTRILPDLQRRWRGRLFVERSQPEYIEFAAGGVSKGGALQWLCDRLGLRRERAVACGDGDNDVDMLRWAGLGVAMGEASPEVRAAADVVVPRAQLPEFFLRLAAAPVEPPDVT
jgi:hydroxymethylpyrimidine pyrophosphatase-like HAD family hydrolase